MKICNKCKEAKPIAEFSKKASNRDGLQYQCKTCCKAHHTKWYAANLDKAKADNAKWRAANPERKKAFDTKWQIENAEKKKAIIAKWYAANPDAIRIYSHNRRARERANGGKLSLGIAEKLFNLQRGKCACCGVKLTDNHLDHVIPIALGGPNEDWNMQLLCAPCNLSKHAKHPIDFMQQRGFLL